MRGGAGRAAGRVGTSSGRQRDDAEAKRRVRRPNGRRLKGSERRAAARVRTAEAGLRGEPPQRMGWKRTMRIERRYTKAGLSPYDLIAFATTKSEIRNPDGSIVFALENIEVPEAWSQVAADVLAQKYFRKAGVPARLMRVAE